MKPARAASSPRLAASGRGSQMSVGITSTLAPASDRLRRERGICDDQDGGEIGVRLRTQRCDGPREMRVADGPDDNGDAGR